MPINYSKWDHIEVSDDEDDTHPNVDTGSLFRWRHQARLERMAEQKKKKEEFQDEKKTHEQKMREIKKKLRQADLGEDAKNELNLELQELSKQESDYRQKEAELTEEERKAPLNIDTISHDGFSKTRISKEEAPKELPPQTEEEREKEMQDFWDTNRKLIKKLGFLHKYDDTKDFLLEHIHLCDEHTANFLTYECLQLEMQEKKDLMEHMAHQCVVIQYLLELAKQLKVNPQTPQLVSNFFSKLKLADNTEYRQMFDDELNQFKGRIRARAEVKKQEAVEEYEREEKEKRVAASPGGLDPVEVFDSLPKSMQDCFESQDISKLQDVALSIDPDEFKEHLDRCIKSGLWVPNANEANEANEEEEEERFDTPDEGPEEESGLRHRTGVLPTV